MKKSEIKFPLPVKGYEGYYEITGNLEIRGLDRVDSSGRKRKSRIIKPMMVKGYIAYGLSRNCKVKVIYLHRLIATTCIPNPEAKDQINHINGIKTDNRIENLEWCTKSENMQHAYKTGLIGFKRMPKGADHSKSNLILDLNTGIYYHTLLEAGVAKNIPWWKIRNDIRRHNSKHTDLILA